MGKNSSNGHLAQLKPEQQLALGRIQKRVMQYQIQASQHTEEARRLIDLAKAADVEFREAIEGHVKRLSIDPNAAIFDFENLQFKKKEAPKEVAP